MARMRTRSPESIDDTRRLYRGEFKPRVGADLRRRVRDAVDLLRLLRRFARHMPRRVDQEGWDEAIADLLLRCAAVDPCMRYVGPSAVEPLRDEDGRLEKRFMGGVTVVHPSMLDDERQRGHGVAIAGIRRCLSTLRGPRMLTEGVRRELLHLATSLESTLVDQRTPLSSLGAATWDLLLELPEDRPLTSEAIVHRLEKRGVLCESSQLRHELRGSLRSRGVRNQPRLGYFIPDEYRLLGAG